MACIELTRVFMRARGYIWLNKDSISLARGDVVDNILRH